MEDKPEMIKLVQGALQKKYNVVYALNGKEALDKPAQMTAPDIIISDIMADVMDGYQFFDELLKHQKYRSIPFIILRNRLIVMNYWSGLII